MIASVRKRVEALEQRQTEYLFVPVDGPSPAMMQGFTVEQWELEHPTVQVCVFRIWYENATDGSLSWRKPDGTFVERAC